MSKEYYPALVEPLLSARGKEVIKRVRDFIDDEVMPVNGEIDRFHRANPPFSATSNQWKVSPILEGLKKKAQSEGLWNLFLPSYYEETAGFTNLEYAIMAKEMGRGTFVPEIFNCSAPDTGNMEVIAKYGTKEQKEQWLKPLMNGTIRSAFCMTEKGVASSDATNIQLSIEKDGDSYVLNGVKWWASGAGDPRCKILIVMGKTRFDGPKHKQQSVVLVPIDTPGVKIIRPMEVFGFDDAPHGHMEIRFENCRIPVSNLVLGEGRGFEIAQGRLGPGRIHHCMRTLGSAEEAFKALVKRTTDPKRKTFGKLLVEHGTIRTWIAESRIEIDQCFLLVLQAAHRMDLHGPKAALDDIAKAKIACPRAALRVIDLAMQAHGAEGLSQDQSLASSWATQRTLRIADGPDEVHLNQLGGRLAKKAAKSKL